MKIENYDPVVEDEELDKLIPPTSWPEFKEKIQEFGEAIGKIDIDSDPNGIHILRGDIGRLAESLRKQNQPFLSQILVVIEDVLTSIMEAYGSIRTNEEFITEVADVQEDADKADDSVAQDSPEATK